MGADQVKQPQLMTTWTCNFRDQGLYHLVKRVDQSAWGGLRARPGPGRHAAGPPTLQPTARRAVAVAGLRRTARRDRRPRRAQHPHAAVRLRPRPPHNQITDQAIEHALALPGPGTRPAEHRRADSTPCGPQLAHEIL